MDSQKVVTRLKRMADLAREGALLDALAAFEVLLRRVDTLADDLASGIFDGDAGAE